MNTAPTVITDNLKMNRIDLVKTHLFIKMIEKKITNEFSDRELSILSHLYSFGGTTDKATLDKFAEHCFVNELSEKKSVQSIRNVFGKARELGVVKRRKSNNWKIDDKFLPPIATDIVFKYLLTDVA